MKTKEMLKIIEIAKTTLLTISMGTEDPHPPYRDLPPSRLKCLAAEALEKIERIKYD